MKNIEIVHLSWIEYEWDETTIYEKFNTEKDRGIYQIYGDHPVYGKNTLLYIGQTKEQSYSKRLFQHGDLEEAHLHTLRTLHLSYFGNTEDANYEKWKAYIDISEEILINAHFPAFNSMAIKKAIDKNRFNNEVLILNWEERGNLLPECSSLRYSTYYWGLKREGE